MAKRILLVAMTESVHTARWCSALDRLGIEYLIFPSISSYTHSAIDSKKVFQLNYQKKFLLRILKPLCRFSKIKYFFELIDKYFTKKISENKAYYFRQIVNEMKPDLIHSLEFQAAGYFVLDNQEFLKKNKVQWLATNWGSDIFLFARLPDHKEKIQKLLKTCNFYSCECIRDVLLAKSLGMTATPMEVFPNTGGFDLEEVQQLIKLAPKPSSRKVIMIKGYESWAGRALFALRAIEELAEQLKEYKIIIYTPTEDVIIAAELLKQDKGLNIEVLKQRVSHSEILKYHSQARISIGLSISDGISTSFLEALAMGSFPIQSFTACCSEWIVDRKSGFIVDPLDIHQIKSCIVEALENDDLVEEAFVINQNSVRERLDRNIIDNKIKKMYENIS